MEILGTEASDDFRRFHNEQSGKLQRRILFKKISTHHDPWARQSNGAGQLVDDTILIWLNHQLPQDQLEALAAHEIMHFTLQCTEDFPCWGGREGIELPFRRVWEQAGSTVQDPIVNRRIAEWSFDSSPEQEMGIRELLATLDAPSFEEPPLYSPKGMSLALKYAYFSLGHQGKTTDRLVSVFKATCRCIWQLGDYLAALIRFYGYETPEQQVNSLKAVRGLLGLRPDHYVIWDSSIQDWC